MAVDLRAVTFSCLWKLAKQLNNLAVDREARKDVLSLLRVIFAGKKTHDCQLVGIEIGAPLPQSDSAVESLRIAACNSSWGVERFIRYPQYWDEAPHAIDSLYWVGFRWETMLGRDFRYEDPAGAARCLRFATAGLLERGFWLFDSIEWLMPADGWNGPADPHSQALGLANGWGDIA